MKRLVFFVNVDWFFISHRLPIAIEAVKRGYDVHVACADTGKVSEIEKYGITVHPISLARSGTNILREIKTFFDIYKVCKKLAPDIVHAVTIKPVVYSSLASRLLGIKKRVFSISGLGYVFIDQSSRAKVIRRLVSFLYRLGLNNPNSSVIFQNTSDMSVFRKLNIVNQDQCRLIRGSGVDLTVYKHSTTPIGDKPIVMFLARLLKDKGVIEFCEAAHQLKQRGCKAEFVLVGDLDLQNPNSLDETTLNMYESRGDISHWGYSNDAATTIAKSTVMVLPSYREGLPKSLIEAAAIGRAVVTTDVPGCRDAIEPGVSGILIPARQVEPLANAIYGLLTDVNKCHRMGELGRELAENAFDIKSVIDKHFCIYEEV
ncbi:glycosyltransferase family 4 protein [Shewanella glacialipiscicola]|uniref:glycosyltransferase family 4 protein n=1 Tax=Shewanella glacialipiscicola TaxID=614069 RepID=UPI0021DB602C|nr:glycosyltransferase family 4 protein [Shewanella glacialipiscicola]MCU7995600.1 glycosyltransferase family 4 protein [Shewanella glacialipiscicola]MCU8026847.1 glycosyltransferase family 4 protein [Shewanella glacialipiscicola]